MDLASSIFAVQIGTMTNPHTKTTPSASDAPCRWGKVKVQLTAEVAKDAEIYAGYQACSLNRNISVQSRTIEPAK